MTVSAAEAVSSRQRRAARLLRTLIGFRTESQAKEATHFPEQARRCVEFTEELLRSLGFSIETWDVGPSATFDAHPVVVATCRLLGGRSLAFNGHLDVVPVGDTSAWTHEPSGGEIANGRLYGRGAADMKGAIAAALYAAKAVLDEGFEPRGDISFHLVTDEEVVGNGTREVAARAPQPDAVVSVEPTNLGISLTEGSLVHFRESRSKWRRRRWERDPSASMPWWPGEAAGRGIRPPSRRMSCRFVGWCSRTLRVAGLGGDELQPRSCWPCHRTALRPRKIVAAPGRWGNAPCRLTSPRSHRPHRTTPQNAAVEQRLRRVVLDPVSNNLEPRPLRDRARHVLDVCRLDRYPRRLALAPSPPSNSWAID